MKEFNDEEVDMLIELYSKKDLDLYNFKIFERARKLGDGKYDFITEDFYYNTLSAAFATILSPYQPKNENREEYANMILGDYIAVTVLLDSTYEAYKGSQIS